MNNRKQQRNHQKTSSKKAKSEDSSRKSEFSYIGLTRSPHADKYFNRKSQNEPQPLPHKHPEYKKWLRRFSIVIVSVLVLVLCWVGWKFSHNILKTFGGSIFGLFTTTHLKGEDVGRVNILLAGNSADDPGHQGAQLTDSIMIISLDTKDNRAFMLSIPRDLWVKIPGDGYGKINSVYEIGQNQQFNQSGYAQGGMGLLEEVISNDFGLQANYYALVDYAALRDAVNAVGGISVNIQSSDPRGLYDPSIDYATHTPLVKLPNGIQTLNGEQALDLARARGDAYGSYGFPQADFNRTANQRLLLLALKNKVISVGTLSNPLTLGQLFDSFGNNVQTDFKTNEVRRLYQLGSKLSNNNISSIGLNNVNGKDLLRSYFAPDGEDALIPAIGFGNYSAIQSYLNSLITPPTTNQ